MRIAYKNQQMNYLLILGIIWFLFCLVRYFIGEMNWITYSWVFVSVNYFAIYLYQRKYKYVVIENGVLTLNGPLGKNIILAEIKQIKTFAGKYIIKTDKKKLIINTQVIDPNSISELNNELRKLDVEWV